MIGVTWINTDPLIASARLRSLIPRSVLTIRQVVKPGRDVVVASKHGWSVSQVRGLAGRMIFDVCDDHFHGAWSGHYRAACAVADEVTCNSQEMAKIIKHETAREAIVIDDPYEDAELEPALGEGVLWFGHASNLKDLEDVAPLLKREVFVVSNHNYSPELLDAKLKECRCTIIPTGKRQAKSANRAIRSIRYGKYPVCGPMPAHDELGLGWGDISAGVEWAMEHDTRHEVRRLQKAIRERFSPDRVADKWQAVICG